MLSQKVKVEHLKQIMADLFEVVGLDFDPLSETLVVDPEAIGNSLAGRIVTLTKQNNQLEDDLKMVMNYLGIDFATTAGTEPVRSVVKTVANKPVRKSRRKVKATAPEVVMDGRES